MQLTEEQQAEIQKIMDRFKDEADSIVAEHHKKVTSILEELDRKKAEEIKRLINSKNP